MVDDSGGCDGGWAQQQMRASFGLEEDTFPLPNELSIARYTK